MSYDPYNCQHGIRWHMVCPACRLTADRAERLAERKRLAGLLLDDHRAGVADYSPGRVNAALVLTGDMGGRLS
jgi:hypothetical protein